ncbi:hypothetical protein OJ252_3165 [Cryptosporidium canis]|uniref:Transmembrane protein n=1 Tax=Cryptosporidium canis TaxID=195482 RepID=A0ABQ8P3F9_9CRYT|nr:hypothetical protein OJ252_3165 [Cryptosporidium canis]
MVNLSIRQLGDKLHNFQFGEKMHALRLLFISSFLISVLSVLLVTNKGTDSFVAVSHLQVRIPGIWDLICCFKNRGSASLEWNYEEMKSHDPNAPVQLTGFRYKDDSDPQPSEVPQDQEEDNNNGVSCFCVGSSSGPGSSKKRNSDRGSGRQTSTDQEPTEVYVARFKGFTTTETVRPPSPAPGMDGWDTDDSSLGDLY